MDTIVILHNPNSKPSRDFVTAYGAGYQVINWYSTEADAVMYKSREMPYPRAFPSVVDTVQKLLVDTPATMVEALAAIDQLAADKAAAELAKQEATKKISDSTTEVNAADFDVMQKAAKTAQDLAAIKAVVSDLILAVARLSEAMGLTPVTPVVVEA